MKVLENGYGNGEGRLPLDEIRVELKAQYQRFIEIFGCAPDHIGNHHHVHMFNKFSLLAEFAKENHYRCVLIDHLHKEGIDTQGVISSDGFDSQFYGDEITQALFLKVLDESKRHEHSIEVMTHPAFLWITHCEQVVIVSAPNRA